MEFIVPATVIPKHTRDLIEAKGVPVGVSVEWSVSTSEALTELEMQALRIRHSSRNVNYTRAAEVKRLMIQGKKCMEIAQLLTRKYGQTMVKKDHAALSGRGGVKK